MVCSETAGLSTVDMMVKMDAQNQSSFNKPLLLLKLHLFVANSAQIGAMRFFSFILL